LIQNIFFKYKRKIHAATTQALTHARWGGNSLEELNDMGR